MAGVGDFEAAACVRDFHLLQPCFKFRGGAQTEHLPQIVAIVEAGGLIIEHDVIGARDASGTSESRSCAATRSRADAAAMPAS